MEEDVRVRAEVRAMGGQIVYLTASMRKALELLKDPFVTGIEIETIWHKVKVEKTGSTERPWFMAEYELRIDLPPERLDDVVLLYEKCAFRSYEDLLQYLRRIFVEHEWSPVPLSRKSGG